MQIDVHISIRAAGVNDRRRMISNPHPRTIHRQSDWQQCQGGPGRSIAIAVRCTPGSGVGLSLEKNLIK